MKNKRGIILVVSLMIMSVLLVLTGTYFSSLLTERRSADAEKFILQALELAEAGGSHAQSELRERIRTDFKAKIATVTNAATIRNYVTNNDSLGFLRNYAYAAGDSQFVISGNQARLVISALDLTTAIQGSYAANIIIEADGNSSNPSGETFIFPYKYSIESQGQITAVSPNIVKNIELLQGSFSLTVRRDTFAKYALFTSHHSTPSGTTVWFTEKTNFTGPVSTNDRLSFANNPSAHFTEEVTQHETKARFYNHGWTVLMAADHNSTIDVPIYDAGFQRGYGLINLPSAVTQTDLKRQALGGPSEPGSNGIYIPNDGTNVTGGIYIRGNQGQSADNATVSLSGDANGPIYTITQSAATKTVTVDYTLNQTRVQTGAATQVYQGIPDGIDNEGVIIYANDDIKSLSGTVQKDSSVTVSGERDIIITNNIQYEQYTSSPLSAEGYTNLLGILSWGGDVRIGTTAPNNLNIHGVVMAPHGVFSVDNYSVGSPRGTATLLGGAITDFYGAFGTFSGSTQVSGYGRNFVYDPRMLEGMAPPYFPYLANFTSFDNGGLDNRLIWKD